MAYVDTDAELLSSNLAAAETENTALRTLVGELVAALERIHWKAVDVSLSSELSSYQRVVTDLENEAAAALAKGQGVSG